MDLQTLPMHTDTLTRPLDKPLIVAHRQCPRRAWLMVRGTVEASESSATTVLLEQGKLVHAAARQARTAAVSIPTTLALPEAARRTRSLIQPGVELLEAAFVADGLGVRMDHLRVDAIGLHITEVKSGGSVTCDYLDDAAIQAACAQRAGYTVASVSIQHPSTAITLKPGAEAPSCLITETVTDDVLMRASRVEAWAEACSETIGMLAEPAIAPGDHCSKPHACPYAAHCGAAKSVDVRSIRVLPIKSGIVGECMAEGMTTIDELPLIAFATPRNALVKQAIDEARPVVRGWLAKLVQALPYPRTTMDFESVAFALPQHPGMTPYEPIPFQWSCTTVAAHGAKRQGAGFLDISGCDPRRGFILSLLNQIEEHTGPVIVYSAYEKTRLTALQADFPDLRDRIQALIVRLIDLLPLARRGLYMPGMRGSWSLKAILRELPGAREKGLCYEALPNINDGMAAQLAYQRATDPSYLIDREQTARDLADYCGLDTNGLMEVLDFVQGHAAA